MITLRHIFFAAYVVMVSVALAFGMSTKTHASGINTLNFITGMATTEVTVYPHYDACYPDGYWHISGSGSQPMYNTPVVHAGACTGMDVKPYANDYGYLGDYTFTHVNVASWGAWTAVANGGWTIRYVGTVVTDEVSGCKGTYWDAAHLHQGGNTDSPPVSRNWSLPSYYGGIIAPTGDLSSNWEHKYVW